MFEYVNQKRDPIAIIFYFVAGVFGLLWGIYPSLLTGFMGEAYLITCLIYVVIPFEFQKREVKQLWFWKAMLGAGALIHLPLMLLLWFLDVSFPVLLAGILPMFIVGAVIGVPETMIFSWIVEHYRPAVAGGATSTTK
jgi:hypothetical protein